MNRRVIVHGMDLTKKFGANGLVLSALARRGLHPVPLHKQADYILCLGSTAYHALTGNQDPIEEARGKIHWYQGLLVYATFSPGVVARNPRMLGLFKQDLDDFCDLVRFDQGATL